MKSVKSTAVLLVSVFALLAQPTPADEGMWPLYDVNKIDFEQYRKSGLELQPEDIYDPADGGLCEAVVKLGATGSFVSNEGLIITNHHVAYGAVQKQSTAQRNLVRDGFYAPTRADEIPAPGYNAWVTKSVEDVTDRILSAAGDETDDLERYRAIEAAIKEVVAEAERDGDIRCHVAEMYEGRQYILYRQFKIRDVRIVYVPPVSIGEYGGDIDNWMWPRHTGDFSFLRAYVAPDGSPAEYAGENVPYKPRVFLPIAASSVNDGDFAMIIGFPGKTNRYASSHYVDDLMNFSFPSRIEFYRDVLDIIANVSEGDEETAIRLASLSKGINNGLKNRLGMLDGFADWNLLQKKIDAERGLREYISGSEELRREYGGIFPGLDSLYEAKFKTRERDFLMRMFWWPKYMNMAFEIHRWAVEREKDDMDRERGYQDRDTSSYREKLEDAQVNLVEKFDRALTQYIMARILDLPEGQRISGIDSLIGGMEGGNRAEKLDAWLEYAYANTGMGNLEERLKMFNMSADELEALNDPFIELARATYGDREEYRIQSQRFSGALSRLQPRLISVYADWKKDELYPDANSTMRVNFGTVRGYSPKEGVTYGCFTGANGVLAKETGADPFVVPAELRRYHEDGRESAYIDASINDVPVNFLTTNDATGGNSGSPVIDGKGRLVGVLFDCNYESIAADYLFNPSVTRAISVDIRYVLHIIDEIYHLDALMEELTLQ